VKRVNITVSDSVYEFYKKESVDSGSTMSSAMSMALKQFIEQREVLKVLAQLNVMALVDKQQEKK
jgi:hypothetical protein